jgi:hypothetical protein
MSIYSQVGFSTDSEAAMIEALTWARITDLEPKLLAILREIKAECPHEHNYFYFRISQTTYCRSRMVLVSGGFGNDSRNECMSESS